MNVKTFTNFYKEPLDRVFEESNIEELEMAGSGVFLKGFTDNYKRLNENIKKSEAIVEQIEILKQHLETSVSREEFETTLATYVIHINESIENLKKHLTKANQSELSKIEQDVINVTLDVKEVVSFVESKLSKESKLLFENLSYQDKKLKEIEKSVEAKSKEVVVENLNDLTKKVDQLTALVDTSIPEQNKKINKFVVENHSLIKDAIKQQVATSNELSEKVDHLSLSLNAVEGNVKDNSNKINLLDKKSIEIQVKVEKNLSEAEKKIKSEVLKENHKISSAVKEITKKYGLLNNQVEKLEEDIPAQKASITGLGVEVAHIQKDVRVLKNDDSTKILKEKVSNVENNVIKINNKIVEYNAKLSNYDRQLIETANQIKQLLNEQKYDKLNKKIDYIEEVLSKFSEKNILTEELRPLPSAVTKDPLTPLNQNFVTFDQLQKHYQLFINRIQQQLSTLGGGGSSKLWDLDDTDYNTVKNPNNGDVLRYNSANLKWEASVLSGGSTFNQNLNSTDSVTFANLSVGNIFASGNIVASGEIISPFFYSESDISLKEDITPIDNPLEKIVKLFGVNFKWKSSKQNSIGFIAQEVEKIVPEIIGSSNSGYKTISYDAIIPLLVEAIKEQQKQIEELKGKIDEKH